MIHAVYPFTPEDLYRAILFDGIDWTAVLCRHEQ
jgi:hypothetical protein